MGQVQVQGQVKTYVSAQEDGWKERERESSHSLPIQVFTWLDDATNMTRTICFTWFPNSNGRLFQKHLHRHTDTFYFTF
jgi:hypothetical protein